ncbi:MAG: hypothetical protein M1401_13210 [Chloroflexi bacterium]|nr:hypothetical protein [Chloroflexota bacterium]
MREVVGRRALLRRLGLLCGLPWLSGCAAPLALPQAEPRPTPKVTVDAGASVYEMSAYADHYQLYFLDERAQPDTGQLWRPEAFADRIDVLPGLLAVATARYGFEVPLRVEVRQQAPVVSDASLSAWEHVAEASVAVPSGRLVVTGPLDDVARAPRLPLPPGTYRLRVHYAGLATASGPGDTEGDDHYLVLIWPALKVASAVLKRAPREYDGP